MMVEKVNHGLIKYDFAVGNLFVALFGRRMQKVIFCKERVVMVENLVKKVMGKKIK